ncbi:MAG TPA: alpha/beta hydrolase [Ohtaekwangia sp.]
MRLIRNVFVLLHAMIASTVLAQQTIPLYNGPIPNSRPAPDEEKSEERDGITRVSKISRPTLTIFPAEKSKSTGTAVIIFPGGGYRINAIDHEGFFVAKKFNEHGITAFVVKYRIPDDATMENREIGPLQDAQQAINIVRQRAKEWNINADRLGIMGFSAGGHLASTAGTHFTTSVIPNAEGVNLRPDFMILIYPVISFQDSIAHIGSRENLIGKTPSKEKTDHYSNELQVTSQTPPTFLVHASDDAAVKPQNSIVFYEQLIHHGVPAELHIYQKGGHGFGMNNKFTSDLWMDRCINWMTLNGWAEKK